MTLNEAIAFGQYSGHESPQRILAEKVIKLNIENARLRSGLLRARASGIRGTGFDAGEAIILARWVDKGCVDDLPEAPPWVKDWMSSLPNA